MRRADARGGRASTVELYDELHGELSGELSDGLPCKLSGELSRELIGELLSGQHLAIRSFDSEANRSTGDACLA